MIEVKYSGRLGNHLFQYCFARILAEGLGYELKAEPIPGFSETEKPVKGNCYSSGYPVQMIVHDYPFKYEGDYSKAISWKNKNLELGAILKDSRKRKIVVDGNFERYSYYKAYKYVIRNKWLKTDSKVNKISPNDIVVNVRRGDDMVLQRHAVPFSFFEEVLGKTEYDRVFICTDEPKDPFFNKFKKYNPIIYHENPLSDFHFVKSFNKIVQSQSTFSWWAGFLSEATELYLPVTLLGYWSSQSPEVDLIVDDEDRYHYIKCKEIYKRTVAEYIRYLKKKTIRKIFKEFIQRLAHKIIRILKLFSIDKFLINRRNV